MAVWFRVLHKNYLLWLLLVVAGPAISQTRPKLVVGIVVDQMRWDYLYRFQNRWQADGGFRRLMEYGTACNKTYLNYLPTYTACGHSAVYTGAVPAVHGITGNQWWDSKKQDYVYCAEDSSVKTVGSTTDAGRMSPVNLLSNTICDELRLATNFRGKTIGIALKDRAAILPAGRSASAAYWYDGDAGAWITSSYYMKELPAWVTSFKAKRLVDSLYLLDWQTLYPANTYAQSVSVKKPYELRNFGAPVRQFPYNLKKYAETNYKVIETLPQGNTFTTEFAKAAVTGEMLGMDSITDFLAISYSSIDYIGHAFGPNSVEMEDALLRLDIDLGNFFKFLDEKVGKGQYLLFLTADHGAAHVPGFLAENKLEAGSVNEATLLAQLNAALKKEFNQDNLCLALVNLQVVLNVNLIAGVKKLKTDDVIAFAIAWLEQQQGIARAIKLDAVTQSTLPAPQKMQIENGYYPRRSGHIQLIYKPGFIEDFLEGGTTHGTGYAYDTHIPLLWYGWGMPQNKLILNNIAVTDIATTIAALLRIQEPNGNSGNVIDELFENLNNIKK